MTGYGLPQRQKDYEAHPKMGETMIVNIMPDGTQRPEMAFSDNDIAPGSFPDPAAISLSLPIPEHTIPMATLTISIVASHCNARTLCVTFRVGMRDRFECVLRY